MREPQVALQATSPQPPHAVSPQGAWRDAWRHVMRRAMRQALHGSVRRSRHRAGSVWVATFACLVVMAATPLFAQIRGPAPQRKGPDYGWWFSGGLSAVNMSEINDGVSNTRWNFGPDPVWQYRGTIEKSLDQFTTVGIAAGYASVDVFLSPLRNDSASVASATCPMSPTQCGVASEMWSLMAQFRSGGGPGFHTMVEASGGGTSFRNFKSRADASPIVGLPTSIDISGTLGGGFGYTLSETLVVSVVQDFGIGFHSKENLPDGVSRTWRVRNTRASLRFKFGGR